MKRPLQVYLDEAEFAQLDAWAGNRGWSKSRAMRVALRALMHTPGEDPLLSSSGMIEALPEDLSENLDRYLVETFVAEKRTPYRKVRSRS